MQLHPVPAAESVVSRRIYRGAPTIGQELRVEAVRDRLVAICAEYGLALAMIEVVPGPPLVDLVDQAETQAEMTGEARLGPIGALDLLDPLGRIVMRGQLYLGLRSVSVEVAIGAWTYRESLLTIRPIVTARRLSALDKRYYERAHALAEHCVAYLTVVGSRHLYPSAPTPTTEELISV